MSHARQIELGAKELEERCQMQPRLAPSDRERVERAVRSLEFILRVDDEAAKVEAARRVA